MQWRVWWRALGVLLLSVVFPSSAPADEPASTSHGRSRDPLHDAISDRARQVTGLYLPGVYFRRHDADDVIRLAERTRTNAVVLDMKDSQGRIAYDTQIPILEEQEVGYYRDAPDMIRRLKAAGLYTIARIVCFADPRLPARHPERAILHIRRDEPWVSWGTGDTWLDPYNRDNHDMVVALAREAAAVGFDEIQLDYVRFPVDDGTQYARYPAEDETSRPELLLELLERIDRAVRIPLGVDVFGLAAYREGDPSGLGQDLAAWVRFVDVYSPMLYINAMRAWSRNHPDRSRLLVETGVSRLRERLGNEPIIRPFLQAFGRGAGHEGFNPRFISRQIFGARRGGADGFLMWHPGARYSMFRRSMHGPARRLTPFPLRSGENPAEIGGDDAENGEPEAAPEGD